MLNDWQSRRSVEQRGASGVVAAIPRRIEPEIVREELSVPARRTVRTSSTSPKRCPSTFTWNGLWQCHRRSFDQPRYYSCQRILSPRLANDGAARPTATSCPNSMRSVLARDTRSRMRRVRP